MGRPSNHEVRYRNVGRPSKIDENVLQKLEDAFMFSFTDEEAALYANISPTALYDYCRKNPEFAKRKEELKLSPNLQAKRTIVANLGNLAPAQWWAERKSVDLMPKSKIELGGKLQTEETGKGQKELQDIVKEVSTKLKAHVAKINGK